MPADTESLPWTRAQKDECIRRGCHQSATEHSDFLREEMAEFIENRFWTVLPYELVRDLEEIMFSPAAVKDERDRKPRLLCDHSWPWDWLPVNQTTVPHAPPEAMQFGGTLPRLLSTVRHANPKFGPTRAAKYDIKDGFYRLFLQALGCLRLALILPRYEGECQLIAIPMACTMGWVQSPPSFCTMSETICDIVNQRFQAKQPTPTHRLEAAASSEDDLDYSMQPRERPSTDSTADAALAALPGVQLCPEDDEPEDVAPPSNCALKRPVGLTDVFVDDFIQLGQGGTTRMRALRNHLLKAIDDILAQPQLDEAHRNEAISLKKLLQGDGSWATRKLILGWIIDTLRQTIELPAHRKETLAQIFRDLSQTRRVSRKSWQKILGKLRFVSVAIPGSASLFSALQLALNRSTDNRVRINANLRSHINAFASLAASLCKRPTHLAEIVPQEPSLLGATDAAKAGMGGVYFDHTGQPFLWRHPFSQQIQDDLVSKDNPTGTVTNSDLEHAGLLAQVSLMATTHPVRYATLANLSDNTPAVSRVGRGAISSDGPAAHLCHYASSHQRQHRYCHVASFISGDANRMADDASRLQHLTDSAFLSHFEQHYPQAKPWKLLHLPPEPASQLTSALSSKGPPKPPLARPAPPMPRSWACGTSTAFKPASPSPSVLSLAPMAASLTSSSLASATGEGARPASLSELIPWTKRFWPWARGSPTWVSPILESWPDLTSYTRSLPASSKPCETKMAPTHAPTQPTSPYSKECQTRWTSKIATGEPSMPTSQTWPSLPSIGSSDRPNTATLPQRKPVPKPFSSDMSISRLTAQSTPLSRPL